MFILNFSSYSLGFLFPDFIHIFFLVLSFSSNFLKNKLLDIGNSALNCSSGKKESMPINKIDKDGSGTVTFDEFC